MMRNVHVKLNPGMSCQMRFQQEGDSFHQQTELKFREETSKVLHLEYSFVWCWNLDPSESRSEVPGKS